jgi:hypothetical protein
LSSVPDLDQDHSAAVAPAGGKQGFHIANIAKRRLITSIADNFCNRIGQIRTRAPPQGSRACPAVIFPAPVCRVPFKEIHGVIAAQFGTRNWVVHMSYANFSSA